MCELDDDWENFLTNSNDNFNMDAEIIDTLLPVPQRLFVY